MWGWEILQIIFYGKSQKTHSSSKPSGLAGETGASNSGISPFLARTERRSGWYKTWPIDISGDNALPACIFRIISLIFFVKLLATISSDPFAVSFSLPSHFEILINQMADALLYPLCALIFSFVFFILLFPPGSFWYVWTSLIFLQLSLAYSEVLFQFCIFWTRNLYFYFYRFAKILMVVSSSSPKSSSFFSRHLWHQHLGSCLKMF